MVFHVSVGLFVFFFLFSRHHEVGKYVLIAATNHVPMHLEARNQAAGTLEEVPMIQAPLSME